MSLQIGVLMIHGTFGSPREFEPLEAFLQPRGYRTRAISLPGHGAAETRKPLGEVTGEEILHHVWAEYTRFAAECDGVVLVGHSLGGVCALHTAAGTAEKLLGIVALGTPFEHAFTVNRPWGLLEMPLPHLLQGLAYVPEAYTKLEPPPFFPWWFPRLIREANGVLNSLQTRLPDIRVPVALGHSPYDMIVPYLEMAKIATRIGDSSPVTCHTLERCGHQIFPSSREAQRVSQLIHQFLQRQGL